jgi:hypothetical protein
VIVSNKNPDFARLRCIEVSAGVVQPGAADRVVLWETVVGAAVVAVAGSAKVVACVCSSGLVHTFGCQGLRLLPPLVRGCVLF